MIEENAEMAFLQKEFKLSDNPFRISPCKVLSQYVERKDELKQFKSNLKWLQQSNIESNIIIVGEKGIGKSSFLYMCMLHARENALNTVMIDSVPSSGKDFLALLLKKTLDAILPIGWEEDSVFAAYLKMIQESQKRNTSSYKVFRNWQNILNNLEKKPIAIFIDETSNLPKLVEITSYFNSFLMDHPRDCMLVLSGTPDTYEKMKKEIGQFVDRFSTIINLEPFQEDEGKLCVEKRLGDYRIKIPQTTLNGIQVEEIMALHPFSEKAIEKILELSNGVPRYIMELCLESLKQGIEKKESEINEMAIERVALKLGRSTFNNAWNHLPPERKRVLVEIAKRGGKVKLKQFTDELRKGKTTVWTHLTNLIETGLVKKDGETTNIEYSLTIDPDIVMEFYKKYR